MFQSWSTKVRSAFSKSTMLLCLSLMLRASPIFVISAIFGVFRRYDDTALSWLAAGATWRYFRFFVNIYSTLRLYTRGGHKSSSTTPIDRIMFPDDVTIIIPTVSDHNNKELHECLATCLDNKPKEIIISTDNPGRAGGLQKLVRSMDTQGVKISVEQSYVAKKRKQMIQAVQRVRTRLILFLDDHVFLPELFLPSSASKFDDPDVALCGTYKNVRLKPLLSNSIIGKYWERLWNFFGIAYLQRHNFEIRATHSMDGGVFVVSGRAMLVRTSIVKEKTFQHSFLNEYFFFGRFGPLDMGDDNFITIWTLELGKKIAMSDSPVETTLGEFPRFIYQCLRWRRTTIQNMSILLRPKLWWRWPWTVWTTYIPSLFNLALFWDFGIAYTLTQTKVYANYSHPRFLLACFAAFVYFSKLIKLLPFFRKNPKHFFLFFFPLPAYHIFAYLHSVLTLVAFATFFCCTWAGRNLPDESHNYFMRKQTRRKRRRARRQTKRKS